MYNCQVCPYCGSPLLSRLLAGFRQEERQAEERQAQEREAEERQAFAAAQFEGLDRTSLPWMVFDLACSCKLQHSQDYLQASARVVKAAAEAKAAAKAKVAKDKEKKSPAPKRARQPKADVEGGHKAKKTKK